MRFLQIVTAANTGRARSPEHMARLSTSIREMVASGTLIATGGIGQRATAAARVASKAGEVSVEDPPAGDSWMAAGGYSLVEFASKEDAIANAKGRLEIMGDGVVELIEVTEMHPPPGRALQPAAQAGPGSGVIPYLSIEGASEAVAFYAKAFAAREIARMPAEDGKRLMHCQLEINGGPFMLADVFPELGVAARSAGGATMQLIVRRVDSWWKRAVDAGCKVKMPLAVAFWGDKYGQLQDPFGVDWALSEPGQK